MEVKNIDFYTFSLGDKKTESLEQDGGRDLTWVFCIKWYSSGLIINIILFCRKLYLRLWGTSLAIYKSEPIDLQKAPMCIFTMQQADAGLALDYVKRRNVIRLKTMDGPQFLMRSTDAIEIVSWVEHLQASANVSTDLDQRKMPKFITLPRRRRRPIGQDPASTAIANNHNTTNTSGSANNSRELWRRSILDTLARDDQNNQDVEQALI